MYAYTKNHQRARYTRTRTTPREESTIHYNSVRSKPVVDAGSGRCFWRASTHPDPEMAKTGRSGGFEEEDKEFDDKKQEFKTEGRKRGSSLLSRHERQRLLDNISVEPPSLPLLAALMSLRHRHRLPTPKLAQAPQHHTAEPNRTMTREAVELVCLIYSLDGLHPGMLRTSAYVWML
jgi:hypothetical protein